MSSLSHDQHLSVEDRHLSSNGRVLFRSVCHQVSTIGVVLPPMTSRYHIHASGLMGSPTVPSTRRLERSNFCGISRPNFIKVRIAVGAV